MNLLNHLRKSIMCVFQTISFLIQMHFLMHFYNLSTQTSNLNKCLCILKIQ